MAPRINVRRLIRHLGGPSAVHQQLTKDGHTISLKGVHMWINRNSIPAAWLVTLQEMAGKRKGLKFRVSDFLERPDEKHVDLLG